MLSRIILQRVMKHIKCEQIRLCHLIFLDRISDDQRNNLALPGHINKEFPKTLFPGGRRVVAPGKAAEPFDE